MIEVQRQKNQEKTDKGRRMILLYVRSGNRDVYFFDNQN